MSRLSVAAASYALGAAEKLSNVTASTTEKLGRLSASGADHLRALQEKLQKEVKHKTVQAAQRRRAFFMSAAEEQEVVERMYSAKDAWQRRLMAFLQSPRLQGLLTVMVRSDAILTEYGCLTASVSPFVPHS
jgi:hypothetical protein